jgi:hypothetical protein
VRITFDVGNASLIDVGDEQACGVRADVDRGDAGHEFDASGLWVESSSCTKSAAFSTD